MWIWIAVATLIVVVVIGFLFGIAGALESIDSGLAEANRAVAGSNGEVRPLPAHIQDINAMLGRVDSALKPLGGQAGQINGALGTIGSTLGSVNGSLTGTSSSLVSTSGSLGSTSSSLVSTSGSLGNTSTTLSAAGATLRRTSGTLAQTSSTLARASGTLGTTSGTLGSTSGTLGDVSTTLVGAEGGLASIEQVVGQIHSILSVAQSDPILGTNAIWKHVRFLNGGTFRPGLDINGQPINGDPINPQGLSFVRGDADLIVGGLVQVNKHLLSICRALPQFPTTPSGGNLTLSQIHQTLQGSGGSGAQGC